MEPEAGLTRGADRLEAAGFGARSGAAILDAVVAYAILLVCGWTWMFVSNTPVTSYDQAVPGYVSATVMIAVWLYLTGTVAGGGTLGMRATGLRVCRTDSACPPGPARAVVRSLVLVAAVWLLSEVHPAIVVAYFLLMLVIPGHRLPHDLAAATKVVRVATSAAPAVTPLPVPVRPNIDPAEARSVLADLEHLRRRSAGDLHRASVPMIVLGLIELVGAGADLQQFGDLFVLPWLYWVVAGPIGIAVTAWWYRRFRLSDGAGPGERDIVVIAVMAGCAAVLGAFLSLGGAITAAGFLAVGLVRHSRVLTTAAAASCLVIGLEQPLHALSTGLTNTYPKMPAAHLLDQHGTTVILALLGMSLFVAGSLTLRQEQSR
ncbi:MULTISPECIES: RDD family protein [unclassified Streptomyces]|uniref:RDD family protein n=1 Tax=unclassified Streptomyces TaxID=2593676 RepID=UPI002258BB5C|nr:MULTISPECIES: RDD family protein [unclassified Streptomyces]MCX5063854.1 RDD family protein [Streptomyces sp. NBC_00452]